MKKKPMEVSSRPGKKEKKPRKSRNQDHSKGNRAKNLISNKKKEDERTERSSSPLRTDVKREGERGSKSEIAREREVISLPGKKGIHHHFFSKKGEVTKSTFGKKEKST